jgi:integration host factor subunit beta
MNKSQLIEALSDELKLSVSTSSGIVDTILGSMADALVAGDNVEIRGFGSFTVRNYEPYEGRNPKTGGKIEVKPKKLPFFKVGLELRKAVDDGGQK